MRKLCLVLVLAVLVMGTTGALQAGEHPGDAAEHPGAGAAEQPVAEADLSGLLREAATALAPSHPELAARLEAAAAAHA